MRAALVVLALVGWQAQRPTALHAVQMDMAVGWAAVAAFPTVGAAQAAIDVAECESKLDPELDIIDVDGIRRQGAWSVGERWWGPVSSDVFEQARQVRDIWDAHGWYYFSCKPYS